MYDCTPVCEQGRQHWPRLRRITATIQVHGLKERPAWPNHADMNSLTPGTLDHGDKRI